MKVIHHNDLDGRCSADIIYHWVGEGKTHIDHGSPDAEYIEMDYAKEFDVNSIKTDEEVWIVDFSFEPAVMKKILARTKNVVWIDHHKSAIEKYVGFGQDINGFRSVKDAGCVLTWEYVMWYSDRGTSNLIVGDECSIMTDKDEPAKHYPVPESVAMIGDYDSWHHKIENSTLFYEGMKLKNDDPGSNDWRDAAHSAKFRLDVIQDGRTCIKYRDNYCADMIKSYGFESEIEGHKCYVLNVYGFGSLGYGKLMDEYDICAGCIFDGKQWTVSLYSKKPDVDVSVICKKLGGGGHKGAAGFQCKELPFKE